MTSRTSVLIPTIAPPDGASDDVKRSIEELNNALRTNSKGIATFDPKAAEYRLWVVIGLSIISLIGALVLLANLASDETDTGTAIAGASVTVASLLVAGFLNPLQTVERDIIFRRWSDLITHAFLLQAADPAMPATKLRGVANSASAQFTALATAYAAVANKSLETLKVVAAPQAGKDEDEGGEEDGGKSLEVTNPGDQTSIKDTPITPLQISATGGDALTYSATGLPDGLTASETGEVAGTPTTVQEAAVSVVVADEAARLQATAQFSWTVEEGSGQVG